MRVTGKVWCEENAVKSEHSANSSVFHRLSFVVHGCLGGFLFRLVQKRTKTGPWTVDFLKINKIIVLSSNQLINCIFPEVSKGPRGQQVSQTLKRTKREVLQDHKPVHCPVAFLKLLALSNVSIFWLLVETARKETQFIWNPDWGFHILTRVF